MEVEPVQVLVIIGTGVDVTVLIAVGEGGRIGWIDGSTCSIAASLDGCWCEFLKIHFRSCAISIIGAAALGMQIPDSLFVSLMHSSGLGSAGLRTGWARARARCTRRARSPVGMSCMVALAESRPDRRSVQSGMGTKRVDGGTGFVVYTSWETLAVFILDIDRPDDLL